MRYSRQILSLLVGVSCVSGLYVPGRGGLVKREPGSPSLEPAEDQLVSVEHGAVACDVPECSEMGVDILRQGGNAADAAVTVALCIGSVNAFSSGIGGGGFMMVRDSTGEGKFINCREMAPQASDKHMFDGDSSLSKIGGLAAGIPGELAGLDEAFKTFGSGILTWKQLIDPVIELNQRGFQVTQPMEDAILSCNESFLGYPEEWLPYLKDNNQLAVKGDTVYRLAYAKTLETIANNGSSAVFYDPNGPIAPNLANAAQRRGGILTVDDFAKYKVDIQEPVKGEFMGREVLTPGNPSSGPALMFGLNVMDGYMPTDDLSDFDPLGTHRMVETMKFMAAQRSFLGDNSTSEQRVPKIISKDWANEIRQNISDDKTHPWKYYHPQYEHNNDNGTAHFSVLDKDGMAVAMTTTVNLDFGAQVADPVTGIVLNSEMDDFSVPGESNYFGLSPSIFNYVEPFKRPLSSMVPTVISNKQTNTPEMVIGASGGSRILTAVFQAIVRQIRYNLPLLETIAYPRIHHQLLPELLYLEQSVPKHTQAELAHRGHNISIIDPKSTMNGIHKDPQNGLIHAVSDYWRKQGHAAGY